MGAAGKRLQRRFATALWAGARRARAWNGDADAPVPATVDFVAATRRPIDQAANVEYARRMLPLERRVAPLALQALAGLPAPGYVEANAAYFTDPFLLDWAPAHGRHLPISYPNRYGATIRGHLFAPRGEGPFPGIVFVPGLGTFGEMYFGSAQGLAERGYVVLVFDPQGQGRSDHQPAPAFCQPGAWQQPQEAGQVEQGTCAGVYPPPPAGDGLPIEPVPTRLNRAMPASVTQMYSLVGPNFVLGALDAAAWFTSPANPLRALVDEDRLGVVGHSLGAYGALVAGNGDPRHRFSAAVALDGYGALPAALAPTIPTMFQLSEHQDTFGPYIEGGAVPLVPAQTASRFRADSVDVAQVALRASTHLEWMYLPNRLIGAGFVPPGVLLASARGERVALHFALAWFDRYLTANPSATARLKGPTFTGPVDAISHGVGTWSPLTRRNRPYTIGGQSFAAHLSRLYASYVATDTLACPNLAAGC